VYILLDKRVLGAIIGLVAMIFSVVPAYAANFDGLGNLTYNFSGLFAGVLGLVLFLAFLKIMAIVLPGIKTFFGEILGM